MLILTAPLNLIAFAYLLIYLLCFLIFIGTAYWLIKRFCPEPIRQWGIAIIVVLCAIGAIFLLLSFANNYLVWPR